MKEYFLSVIIPVYNAETYLEQCIGSLHMEKYKDMQVILINDGSRDSSGDICRKYQRLYPEQVVYIEKENAGVSAARNDGIVYARGTYSVFVDADDYVAEDYMERVKAMVEEPAELYLYNYVTVSMDNRILDYSRLSNGKYRMEAELLKNIYDEFEYQAWNKLFLTRIIHENQLRFDTKLKWSEDLDFWTRYIMYVSSIRTVEDTLYFYHINEKGAVCNVKVEALGQYHHVYQHQVQMLEHYNADVEAFRNLSRGYIEHLALTIDHCIHKDYSMARIRKELDDYAIAEDLVYSPASLSAKYKRFCLRTKSIFLIKVYFKLMRLVKK